MKYHDFIDKRKLNISTIIPALQDAGYDKKADHILQCGNRRFFGVCKECGATHFNGVLACKQRFCAVCQKKRSLLWYMRMLPLFKYYMAKGNKIVFVTFTVKDTEKLTDGLNYLQDAFRLMIGKGNKITKAFNCLFLGGVRSIEIKRGANSGLWHPHAHCLFIKRDNNLFKKDFEFLRSVWNDCLCTVHGERAKWGSVDYKAIKVLNDGCKAICECFKYSTKFDWQNNTDDVKELVESLHRQHLIVPFGEVRKDLNESSIEHDLILPYTQLKKQFCAVCGNDSFDEIYIDARDCNKLINIYDFMSEDEND